MGTKTLEVYFCLVTSFLTAALLVYLPERGPLKFLLCQRVEIEWYNC